MAEEEDDTSSILNEAITSTTDQNPPSSSSNSKLEAVIHSLSSILPSYHPPPSATPHALLHDSALCDAISSLLRHPDSGSGDNNLCRWLYDTFQSSDPALQLLVLRFLPLVAGLYLTRVHLHKPLAGFEAILLALYAHETTSRAGQSVTLNITNLAHPSTYHDPKDLKGNRVNSDSTEVNLAVVSPSLEPHGTVRSTRRARIVGIALELYYRNVAQMPVSHVQQNCFGLYPSRGQPSPHVAGSAEHTFHYRPCIGRFFHSTTPHPNAKLPLKQMVCVPRIFLPTKLFWMVYLAVLLLPPLSFFITLLKKFISFLILALETVLPPAPQDEIDVQIS